MMKHPSCVAIHVRPVEIQVNTRTKFVCMLRHSPKWSAATNVVVESQVIAVETQAVFVEIQVKFNLLFNKSNMYFNRVKM